jgi:acyl-CoA thioesterase-1
VDTFNAYPHLFHRALKEKHPHGVINVIVTAIGGENSVQGAARFEKDVLSLKPDLIFIDYALNDRGLGLERSRDGWTSMIEAAKKTKALLVLMTPTPDLAAKMGSPDEPLTQQSQQIRRLASDYSLPLVDSYKEFCRLKDAGRNLADFMSQGNHPNRAGHDVVTAKLMELIDP